MRALQVPVADGFELPLDTSLRSVYASAMAGLQPKTLMAGSNMDDISIFLGTTTEEVLPDILGKPLVTVAQMRKALPRFFPNATDVQSRPGPEPPYVADIMCMYNVSGVDDAPARSAFYAFATDGYFACPTRRIAHAAATRNATVYR